MEAAHAMLSAPPAIMAPPERVRFAQFSAFARRIPEACAFCRPQHPPHTRTLNEVRLSYGTSGDSRLSKNEKREAAREKARVLREEQKKKDKKRKSGTSANPSGPASSPDYGI